MCNIINYGFTKNTNLLSGPSCVAEPTEIIGAQTQIAWIDGVPPAGSIVEAQVFLYKNGVFVNTFSSAQYTVSSFTGTLNIPLTGVIWEVDSVYTLDWSQLIYPNDPLNPICISGPLTRCTTLTIQNPTAISCTTTPSGARIWLDGSDTGQVTPYTLQNITVGNHTVTFRLAGYNDCPVNVNVTAGSTEIASCSMTQGSCTDPGCGIRIQ